MIEVLASLMLLSLGIYFVVLMIELTGNFKMSEIKLFGTGYYHAKYRMKSSSFFLNDEDIPFRETVVDTAGFWVNLDEQPSEYFFFENKKNTVK